MKSLRFGILGTASVNDYAFLPVIKKVSGARLVCVASRDKSRARHYAKKRGIPEWKGSYEAVIDDPDIDCVYIPLPVSMHAEWSVRALQAGKHVLCEKPMGSTYAEAMRVAACADASDRVFMEAYHYRYHPLMEKIEEIVRSGDLGGVVRITSQFGVPLMDRGKVQFQKETAGGSLLDIGCYPVSFSRVIADCDDASVLKAQGRRMPSGTDGDMSAELRFDNGVEARIRCSLIAYQPMYAHIACERGALFILTPFTPGMDVGPIRIDTYLLLVRRGRSWSGVRVPSAVSYQRQLETFVSCVNADARPKTDAREGAAVLRIIESICRRAGFMAGE